MERLAWPLGIAGVGGGSLAFAVVAPRTACWVLGLIVPVLVAGPHLVQWWLSRARRTERLAARWWRSHPDPLEVAFLCGGPDRVVDLAIADLVAEGRLTVADDGRLGAAHPAGPHEAAFRQEIHSRLLHGNTDIATLRCAARSASASATAPLWRAAVHQRLMLPAWRREHTPWFVAGMIVAVGYSVAVALGQLQRTGWTLGIGAGAVALGILSLWRTRFLVGYGFDPRTAAGLRAAALARDTTQPDTLSHFFATQGIRSASDLRPGAPDPHSVPRSQWDVPWYGPRVPEPELPWWREVAQTTTADG
ncbi:TIGR04222 domain-containing membrane protein [Krasilnikovia sp. M28-CT-15]|uniref:TIGR04222 domain-containing membrane protein n=1 Tax=Krasilnikovia sp. M28-CT-15 TaxID=3373540 RepID=UPI003875FCE5